MSRDALVVGINNYEYLKSLSAPALDAEAIAQLLTRYGDFKVTRLPAVKDKENNTVRVGKETKVSQAQVKKAIVQLFIPEGNPSDTALFYFSGHGLREKLGIEEGYLATSDSNPIEGFYGISLQWLRRLLQESPVRQQIIILDCCYSGELLNFTEADPGDRGKGRDRCFIAASRAFEVAYEEIGNQHSVLTSALLKGLEAKQEKWVTNYALIEFLNQKGNSFPQRPIFANSGETINLTRRWTASKIEFNATSEQAICPYKGLAYFDCTEEDAKYFYGRTPLTDQLLEKVRVGTFVAVLGASGSGKSSVVRAGLLYQLKLGQRLSGSDSWQIKIFRPGEHPLQNLALAFIDSGLSDIERASQLTKAEELIAKGKVGLGQLINSANSNRVMLVADQFEEVFTLCQDIEKRKQFFECLLGALQYTGNKLCIILTMRADFFGKCTEQDYSGLAQHIEHNLATITPMTEDELRQAIVEPAKRVRLEIEPELVEEMLVDVADAPGILPLLQYTLTEMWKQHSNNCLQLKAYVQLGRVKGTLQKRATDVYESLSAQEQQVAKRIFLELTQLGEGTEDTRRRVLLRDLVTSQELEVEKLHTAFLVEQVIQKLTDAKLIVTNTLIEKATESGKVAVIDVAHEALIRHWFLLKKWLDENRDKIRNKRKIEVSAQEWQDKDKADGYLLQGKPLEDAVTFQKAQSGNLKLSYLAEELIKQSLRYRRNNRIQIYGLGLGIPVALSIFVGGIALQNLWVSNPKGDFSSADLSYTNLKNVNLRQNNLNGVNLTKSNLTKSNLSEANFSEANLSEANLSEADLTKSNLTKSNLSKANLSEANLSEANLTNANLQGADLTVANLQGALYTDKSTSRRCQLLSLSNASCPTIFPPNFDPKAAGMKLVN